MQEGKILSAKTIDSRRREQSMVLTRKGKYWYGTNAEDIETEIIRYSTLNEYIADRFRQSRCSCGGVIFKLESDEDAGAARRVCTQCGAVHLMGDSAEYEVDAAFEEHACVCGQVTFELLSGVARYDGTNDVRWNYIGCLCTNCHLVGVFADWKCESGDADSFLAEV
jgi:hypothetical protein